MKRQVCQCALLVTGALPLLPAAAPLGAQAGPESRALVVLATTDVHGRLRNWDYYDGRPDSARSLASAATIVDSIRAANRGDVVLVDAGDLLQGNPLTTMAARADRRAPQPVIAAMNAMQYDAAALGNHEFNYGMPFLRAALSQARFPFLSANLRATRPLRGVRPYTLVRRGDVTVGIVGATTPGVMVWDRDHVRGQLTMTDIVPAVRRAVAAARRDGADVVVVVAHTGLDGPASYDTVATRLPSENVVARIAHEVAGVDLIVYGHSHREMVDTVVNGVRLMQPRHYAASVAVARLQLARAAGGWRVTASSATAVRTTRHAESPAVLAASESAHRAALAYVSESLAVSRVPWRATEARAIDAPLTDLVGEVMRRAAGAQLAASPAFSLDARLDSGAVTTASIATLYPFDNTLRAVRVTGAQLRAFLEHSATYWKTWTPQHTGSLINSAVPGYNFDLVVGAHYDIDLSQPVGERIRALRVNGRPVQPTDRFTLALSNYRQTGGGGYAMLANAPVVYESREDIRELVIAAVRRVKVLSPADWAATNWRLLPAAAEAAALASLRSAAPSASMTRLRVIGLNDFHGAFESRIAARGQPFGGAGALTAAIRRAQASCVAPACYSIIVDGGDEFQGTPASNLAYGRTVVTLFDSIGVTAAALGNHEFDYGQDSLRARIAQASYAILAANLRDTLGRIPPWVRQDTLVQRGPLRIGIIGISTVETPRTTRAINVADLRFLDPAPIVSERAAALRARGANVIVVTGHVGGVCNIDGVCDGEIFSMVNRLTAGVDVVVSGHSHTLLNTRLRGVPIVQARSRGEAIDIVDIAVGDSSGREAGSLAQWRVLSAGVHDVMSDTLPADPQAARIAAAAVRAVAPVIARPVGTITADMRREGPQYALGNLVADAMRDATGSDLAVMNSGGIRANLLAGPANFGRLYEVQPFGNTLFVLRVRGSDLRAYLGRLVAGSSLRAHVSGVQIRYDPARPADDRIVSLTVNGARVDPAREYTITLNDFMVTGGDGLGLAGTALETRATNIVDLDALVAYVERRPAGVTPPAVDRILPVTP
jgi:2',3'-cyclic-nucleotide 2'-phosphodiesterase / 3'-nucleotidase / 5'-nucleotidase